MNNPMMMNGMNQGMGMNPMMMNGMGMNQMNQMNQGMGMNQMNQMNQGMGMNQMNQGMGMNGMFNPNLMGGGMNQGMGGMGMNPMMNPMMNGMGMNPMMNMGGMNPMMMNGMNMGMGMNNGMMNNMTPQQIEEMKRQKRYMGYLMGKKMAEEKRKKEQGNNPTQVEEASQVTADTEITIKFKKNGTTKDIKMKAGEMIATLIGEYYEKTNNQGPFKYKGNTLSPEDCTTLLDHGMKNNDEIIVG